ncbi:hypothetical protein ACIGXM_19415 [Kitasatospora sp. NPDC052896]|uniref:hypothetical protein n=1 Tax=Kitasatospora sp. NPDC052896 TaxID=3364061 RepID=UPI0037CB131A
MIDTFRLSCEQLHEIGAELALGVLPARERAAAVEHLQHCPGCREHIRELAFVADALLDLIPGEEPPVGFEARTLQRIGIGVPPQRSRRRRLRRASLALAALSLAGAGGWAIGNATEQHPPANPATSASALASVMLTAHLDAGGHEIGQAFVFTGGSPWVYLSVDTDGIMATGTIRCEIQRGDGSTVTVGSFPLSDGYGHWAGPYPPTSAPVTGIRLVTADGSVLAAAALTNTQPS